MKKIIDYDALVQKYMRHLVKEVLNNVSKNGLQNEHHFFVNFSTKHPLVDMPDYLKENYPNDITIVIQHEFWDLEVFEDYFLITLCFNDQYERLSIPFASLIGFADPSVKFGLEFIPDNTVLPSSNSISNNSDGNVISLDSFRKKN